MAHHDMPPMQPDKRPMQDSAPPAAAIHVRGLHIQVDRLCWPRWPVPLVTALVGASAGAFHLLTR